MTPLSSIVIPTYNAEGYIKEAVDSALAETYKNCEVIVVDDGSTDGTKKLLLPYIEADKIKYVYQRNKGLAGARNTGIRKATGKYIALLDADDLFLPDKMAEQVAALEANPDYTVCYCDILHFSDTVPKKLYHHVYKYPSGDVFEFLLHRQFINPLSVVARKEVFDKYGYFDEELRRSEDWDLWLRWARAGVKFFYLNKILAHYRVRGVGNLSAVESEPVMKEKSLELFSRFGRTLGEPEKVRYQFSNIIRGLKLKLAFAYLMVGDKKAALGVAREVSGIWPFVVNLFPGIFWKLLLRMGRRVKHRLLLRRL